LPSIVKPPRIKKGRKCQMGEVARIQKAKKKEEWGSLGENNRGKKGPTSSQRN